MKGWISGIVVGVVLGSALAGAAQDWKFPAWDNQVKSLRGSTEDFRLGYIEGADDAFSAIGYLLYNSRDMAGDATWLQKRLSCLNTHTQRTAAEFLRWADRLWQADDQTANAAGALLADACK